MKHFPPRNHRLGPHVVSGELYFQMPGGAAIRCCCIEDPYASIIQTMWDQETGRKAIDFETVRTRLLEAIEAAGGRAKWARANRLNEEYVADVIRRKREPSECLCTALGLRRQVAYLPIETEGRAP